MAQKKKSEVQEKKTLHKDEVKAGGKASAKKVVKKTAKNKSAEKKNAKKAPKKGTSGKQAPKKGTSREQVSKRGTPSKHAANKQAVGESKPKDEQVKSRRSRVKQTPVPGGEGEAEIGQQDPFEIARQTMKGSVPAIVKTMVEKAKQGSCPHAKTLLEMTGAKHMFGDEAEDQARGEPWAKLVLERLGEAESSDVEEVSTRDASEQ